MFTPFAWLIDTFYGWTHNYAIAIALVALAIMIIIAPLTMKSTKGMLEMQRLQPEMKKLQQQYKGDRQMLNQEMMKLYSDHKVNPLASCLPLLAQMPVFIIMFRVLTGITRMDAEGKTFDPDYISKSSDLYKALDPANKMLSFGLDLHLSPSEAMQDDFVKGLPYALLIVALGGLFFIQQRMVASRTSSPTMSPTQAKIMQYLPVAFAIFQVFLPTALVVYYMVQAVFRILQQGYITRRFYGEDGLGKQAQEASAKARELGKDDSAKPSKQKNEQSQAIAPIQSKRVTPGKNRPAPSGRPARPVPPSKRNK
jgi:YidC/Oxa1 family membrane protein insertase